MPEMPKQPDPFFPFPAKQSNFGWVLPGPGRRQSSRYLHGHFDMEQITITFENADAAAEIRHELFYPQVPRSAPNPPCTPVLTFWTEKFISS